MFTFYACVLCASVLIFSTQKHKDTETMTTKSNVNIIIYGRFLTSDY